MAEGKDDLQPTSQKGHEQTRREEDRIRISQIKEELAGKTPDDIARRQFHLEQRIRELEQRLNTDPKTGLVTYASFQEQLEHDLAEVNENPSKGNTLLITDIDYFGQLNEEVGHQTADEALKEAANAMKKAIRREDTAARWGGEEYSGSIAVNYDEPFDKSYYGIHPLERVRQQMSGSPVPGTNRKITVSAGGAHYRPREDIKNYFDRADEALRIAKLLGRDCAVLGELDNEGNTYFNNLTDETVWKKDQEQGIDPQTQETKTVEYLVNITDNTRRKIITEKGKKPYLEPLPKQHG